MSTLAGYIVAVLGVMLLSWADPEDVVTVILGGVMVGFAMGSVRRAR